MNRTIANSKCADKVAGILLALIIKHGSAVRVIGAIAKNKGERK